MGDAERGRITLSEEDRLPWLEAVEDEDEDDGVSIAKLIALVVVALIAIGLVIGGIFWIRQGIRPKADGSLIAAPAGNYKVPATDANGMAVEGVGDASYAASQGANVSSTIDTTTVPERPVTEGMTQGMAAADAAGAQVSSTRIDSRAVAAPAPVRTVPLAPSRPAVAPAPAKPAERAPSAMARTELPKPEPASAEPAKPATESATADAGAAASKQIGAYSSEAKAEAGQKNLTSRFPALHSLTLSIQQGTSNGKTVYRIFMKGGRARVNAVCAALHSAKEGCIPG